MKTPRQNTKSNSRRDFLKKATQTGALLGSTALISPAALGAERNSSEDNGKSAPRLPMKIWLSSSLTAEMEKAIKGISPEISLIKASSPAEKENILPEITACFGPIGENDLKKAKNLQWVHSSSAGVEKLLYPEMMRRQDIQISNAKGCFGPAIAEHTFGLLFALTRGIKEQTLNMSNSEWKGVENQVEMRNMTMGIIGYGGIGREIARRAKAMDLKVLAADIRPMSQETTGCIVDELYDMHAGGFEKVLANSHIVVSAVPHTALTEGMFNANAFEKMPKGAYFINISRGKVTNTSDLMNALDNGHLAGAGLDVTDPEPLPDSHPLWKYPNVIVTSHVSGRSQYSHLRSQQVFVDNVDRFTKGLPLIHLVDKEAGF